MPSSSNVPQRLVEFAKKVVELAKAENMRLVSVKFEEDSFLVGDDAWQAEVQAVWRRGRHSEPSSIDIQSTQFVRERIEI